MSVSCSQAADDGGAGNGAGDERDEVAEFGFDDGVEVCGGANGCKAIAVCEGAEDADSTKDISCCVRYSGC